MVYNIVSPSQECRFGFLLAERVCLWVAEGFAGFKQLPETQVDELAVPEIPSESIS